MLPQTSPLSPPVNQLLLPETQVVPSERFRTCTTSPWGYYQTSVTQIKRCPAPRVPLAEVRPDRFPIESVTLWPVSVPGFQSKNHCYEATSSNSVLTDIDQ